MKQIRASITAKEKFATWRESVYDAKKQTDKKWWAKWLKK